MIGGFIMKDIISKCGANCGRCPAYKENLITEEDRQRVSDRFDQYFGIQIKPDAIYCDGCHMPDADNPVLLITCLNCKIRECAIQTGVETCAHCSGYPCEDLKALASRIDREKIASRIGTPIPEEDYLIFIEPYELLKHLNEIRASLGPKDIVAKVKVSPANHES